MRVAVIGARPGPIGGTTILVEQLIRGLKAAGVQVFAVDLARTTAMGVARILWTLAVLISLVRAFLRCDVVSIHVSVGGFQVLLPLVVALSRVLRTPLLVRYFGGDVRDAYRNFPPWLRSALVRVCYRHATFLGETREVVEHFRAHGAICYQYLNTRPEPAFDPPVVEAHPGGEVLRKGRYVFVSQLKRAKGVLEAVQAAEQGEGFELDVYGPADWDVSEQELRHRRNVCYRGVAPLGKSQEIISQYDALVFPSYYPGESYAGVIVESYSVGRPVVASRWQALPELVRHGETGLLVPPGDVRALRTALEMLAKNRDIMAKLGANARQFFVRYLRSDVAMERFVDICRSAAERRDRFVRPDVLDLP